MINNKDQNTSDDEGREDKNSPDVDVIDVDPQSEQELNVSSAPLPKKDTRHKRLLTTVMILFVLFAGAFTFALLINSSDSSRNSENRQTLLPPDTDYPEDINDEERAAVSKEVTAALSNKYGADASFEVLEMKKGKYQIGDVGGIDSYFDIRMRIVSSELTADFMVDYRGKSDNLWKRIEDKYRDEIVADIQKIDPRIYLVDFSLSDYNGYSNDSKQDFNKLSTVYGRIPTRDDLNLLIQNVSVHVRDQNDAHVASGDIREYIDSEIKNINNIYNYVADTFTRIPKGTGTTSVVIDFSNAVAITLLPLSETVHITAQNNDSHQVDYEWSDIIN